jgi:hypothetical protein
MEDAYQSYVARKRACEAERKEATLVIEPAPAAAEPGLEGTYWYAAFKLCLIEAAALALFGFVYAGTFDQDGGFSLGMALLGTLAVPVLLVFLTWGMVFIPALALAWPVARFGLLGSGRSKGPRGGLSSRGTGRAAWCGRTRARARRSTSCSARPPRGATPSRTSRIDDPPRPPRPSPSGPGRGSTATSPACRGVERVLGRQAHHALRDGPGRGRVAPGSRRGGRGRGRLRRPLREVEYDTLELPRAAVVVKLDMYRESRPC